MNIFEERQVARMEAHIRDHFRCNICGNPIDYTGYYCQECFEKYCEEITGKTYEDFVNEE